MTAAVALLLTQLSDPLAAGGIPPMPGGERIALLEVYHTDVPHSARDLLHETADTLLAAAGVEVDWVACDLLSSCRQRADRTSVVVRFVATRSDKACGRAEGRLGESATILILVPCATALHRTVLQKPGGRATPALASLQVGQVMGVTLAHEIGHVLGLSHAESGVMKARLELEDLLALRTGRLGFRASEMEQMRLKVRQRYSDGSRRSAATASITLGSDRLRCNRRSELEGAREGEVADSFGGSRFTHGNRRP